MPTIDAETRKQPKETLQRMDVHEGWIRGFRTSENDHFYKLAFDYIATVLGKPTAEAVLDAGCGSGIKCIHLARSGYNVLGIDFAPAILNQARAAVEGQQLQAQVQFALGDLTSLTIPSGTVRYALCWGVLMHVPDLQKAAAELARVISPGGRLIVSEGNFRSVQARTIRLLRRLFGRRRARISETPAGIEFWEATDTGELMTRQADIPFLIDLFEQQGLRLIERRAGQFSEIYTLIPWKPVRSLVHAFNSAWFRWIRFGGPAFANILVFERPVG